ncbi:type II secretion system F family protein [Planctomycetes bacterium K23_9]|uniref:Type II secretion system protein GspF domain-containing protein n=1 Tax=Stieleria marina TaxID=1930275 RepID=A0A517NY50_9BACT|nr:hypothetical protein K239x_40590 [Planctomycetes bacterium K23_9]
MNTAARIAISIVAVMFLMGFFGFVVPSLIGFLITVLLVVAINDFFSRRYRQAARTFNSAAQAVAHQEGAIAKIARAFARRGPLSRSCYEYTRRLLAGEDPIEAASRSRVPLQLTTAVAMKRGRRDKSNDSEPQSSARRHAYLQGTVPEDASLMQAYAPIMYLIATALITCVVLGFMSTFIMPTMDKMMDEFGIAPPNAWWKAGRSPTQALLTLVILTLLALVPILTTGSLFGIPVPRWMPVSPQMVEDKTNILRGLADAIDSGMTVDQSLQLGAQVSIKNGERRSLLHANSLIRQGVPPADSLRRSGWLSSRECDWLRGSTAQRGAELLRWVADQRVRDARANLRWLMGLVFPLLVVLLGMAVLSYSVGFFSILVSLIRALS